MQQQPHQHWVIAWGIGFAKRLGTYGARNLGWGLLILGGLSLAAPPPTGTSPVTTPVLRTTRLEVVDDAGHVIVLATAQNTAGVLRVLNPTGQAGFEVSATALGGRLSVLNPAGQEIFSAGLQNARKVPGLWERQQRTLEQQRQELDRQQQAFTQMTHDLQAGEFQRSRSSEVQRLEQTIGQLRRDLDQQRRELDQQRWLIAALERQLSSLQHR